MTDTKSEITQRLSVLIGLDVSAVSHAADMLTIHFGPQKQYTTRRGAVLQGGTWALHVQCQWQIARAGVVVATQAVLAGSDDAAHRGATWLNRLLVTDGPTIVKSLSATEFGGFQLEMANSFCLEVVAGTMPDEEDWRLFEPGSGIKHFVVEGGNIDPWSLS
ncbi:hypothetical protein [Caballeronia sp. SL2Y3]|uniref:hypothetical protein n=1 Tax=Caballeronia sp. SL2Y3 TaxID=2878151 RepID=UPI001FD5A2C8|nr:hypothetical protein [Caballeronia sp. SL2Y3]